MKQGQWNQWMICYEENVKHFKNIPGLKIENWADREA